MVIIHYEVEYDMNKLILLSEVIKEKTKIKNGLVKFSKVENEQENSNESYVTFKEKFKLYQDNEESISLNNGDIEKIKYNKYDKKLNKIMKRIFSMDNKALIIEFINSIYNDDLSINSNIEYINDKDIISSNEVIILKNSNYNIRFLLEDEYKKFEYKIQFETKDDQNIAIIITKLNLSNYNNIISLNKKKKEHEINDLDESLKGNITKCIVMLNSNMEVPDIFEFKSDFSRINSTNKVNIIKGWKYDFKQLFEKNMHLLFPMKVLDLRKRLLSINEELLSKDLIKDEISRFFKDMNKYLIKIKDMNLITGKEINELNSIATDLLNHFTREKNNIFIDIKRDIEATLKNIVV